MKLKKLMGLGATAFLCISAIGLAGCGGETSSSGGTSSTGGETGTSTSTDSTTTSGESFVIWCPEEQVETTTAQVEAFRETSPDFTYTVTVNAVGEGEAATNMLTDVTAGADLFFFAQDQLARLVQAGALTAVNSAYADDVSTRNDAGSVAAGTMNDTLYAYPLTSDNGYFMYYDKSVISEDIINDQTAIIAACEAAGKQIGFQLSNSGWYNAAYFFGAGCVSDWTTDSDGNFTGYVDTYNSDEGKIAVQGMAELEGSSAYVGTDLAQTSLFESGAAVVVSGTWDYETAYQALGENMGCAKLWSYTVDGQSYQLGSFSGNKLLGVKPQSDATKAAWCQALANYLTDEECQRERFEISSWGPSNITVQESDEVQANPALAALAEQSEYATPQGQYPNSWWDVSKAIGVNVASYNSKTLTDDQIQAVLDAYQEGIEGIMNPSFVGWHLVGTLADESGNEYSWALSDEWSNMTTDYLVNSYTGYSSTEPYTGIWERTFNVVDSDGYSGFRICDGDWGNGIGYNNLTSDSSMDVITGDAEGDGNVVVSATGSYTILLDTTGDTATLKVTYNG